MSFPHGPNLVSMARSLRKSATPWENKLWYEFLARYSVRFQRQKPIGRFVADFYCARARLVIELDGGQHYDPEAQIADSARTAVLEAYGLQVLRFSNLEVIQNFSGVCQRIDRAVTDRLNKRTEEQE